MMDESALGERTRYQLSSALDGHIIEIHKFEPTSPPKALIIIAHGMAEHPERYTTFSEMLCDQGFVVVAPTHRGHGSQPGAGGLGHFSDHNGWDKVIADIDQVYHWAREKHSIPFVLLGHSMGSFIAQAFVQQFRPKLAALILSGTNYQPPFMYSLGLLVAKLERLRLGKRRCSKLIDALTFGGFNRRFKPARTPYDWLSRDTFQVDAYCQDSLCGFSCTTQFWVDFMTGLKTISTKQALKRFPETLPILIFGGDQDPVGQYGKGLIQLEKKLLASNLQKTHLIIYPGGRHEMLNEENRSEVYQDIIKWINEQISTKAASQQACPAIAAL